MKQIILLSLLAIIFASCNSSTSPSSGITSGPTVRPGVGSMFVTKRQEFDTLDRIIFAGYDTIFVIASGISYAGKNNVVQFRSGSDVTDGGIGYANYETNGDMAFYNDAKGRPGSRSGWITVPIISKGSSSLVVQDST